MPAPAPVPVQEIFRRTGNWSRGDVANDSGIIASMYLIIAFYNLGSFILKFKILNIVAEGIQLTGYHRLGTVHIAKPSQRHNNDDLSVASGTAHSDIEAVKKLAVSKESTLR